MIRSSASRTHALIVAMTDTGEITVDNDMDLRAIMAYVDGTASVYVYKCFAHADDCIKRGLADEV